MSAQQVDGIGCTAALDIARGNTRVPMYIGRRNVEGGDRQQDFHNSSFRGVFGVKGAISGGLELRHLRAVRARDGGSDHERILRDDTHGLARSMS